jgi:hypothetical protein
MLVEWWVVFATLAGPVLAVQTQKWIERATERRRRRLQIFSVLMSSRATRLADDFVRALNMIDLEFRPGGWWTSKHDREVRDAWKALFGELNNGPPADASESVFVASGMRRDDRLVDLLSAMSKAVGYSFSSEELRRGIYHPQGSVEREQAQLAVLDGVRKIVTGQASLQMAVKEFPSSPEIAQAQTDLARKAAAAYDEQSGALKVRQIK